MKIVLTIIGIVLAITFILFWKAILIGLGITLLVWGYSEATRAKTTDELIDELSNRG